MSNSIIGVLYSKGVTEQKPYKDKVFFSRQIVLRQDRYDQYTGAILSSNYLPLEISGDEKCRDMEELEEGRMYKADYFPKGVKYIGKTDNKEHFFLSLQMLRIESFVAGNAVETESAQSYEAPKAQPAASSMVDDEGGDLPCGNEDKLPWYE